MRHELVIGHWRHRTEAATSTVVVPDGCRDLIVRMAAGSAPTWSVSSLQIGVERVQLGAGVSMMGWRLRPGAILDVEVLLRSLSSWSGEPGQVVDCLHRACRVDRTLEEALGALAVADVRSVAGAAGILGICARTLQRTVRRGTGLSPAKWLQLARVRRAGRAVATTTEPLAQLAAASGYADQAHMTRDFRQWLGTTPSLLRGGADLRGQLLATGYG